MGNKRAFDKNYLLRSLITRVCIDRELPDLKYDEQFMGEYNRLFRKLVERKGDLPSISFLQEKYDFSPQHNDLTITDIMEELNSYFIEEQTTKIIEQLIRDSKTIDVDSMEMLDRVTKNFGIVRQAVTKAYTVNIATDYEKIVEEYIKVSEGGAKIPTGFDKLDEIVGLRAGNLVGICAGTGAGKTISMVKIQSHLVKMGISTMYFSLEMGLTEMTNRLLAAMSKFSFYDMHNFLVTPEAYGEALKEIAQVQTHIVTRQSESKIDLATIERYVVEHKPKVVFIDYLTLIDADTSWNAEESVTKVLKRIALQNNCLIIFAAQADTDANRTGEIPLLTSVRGNKAFPYDCDVFIGVCSKRLETEDGKMKMYYAVRKSRNGGFPEFSYRVNLMNGSWEECTGEMF